MTTLVNNTIIGENTYPIIHGGETGSIKKTSSRKVDELLKMGPQTTNYINKKEILIADDDMISIFGKTADKRYGSIKRGTTEIRSLESAKNQIEEGLNEDFKICDINSIHHIEMSVESFKHLYIEGVITKKMLEESQVASGLVIIYDVEFETKKGKIKLPIFISPDYKFSFATVNNKGMTI